MQKIYMKGIGLAVMFSYLSAQANDSIPAPDSWSFPEVVESARKISPNNIEGRAFNEFGLVYSPEELATLVISSMSASELQKYADIVTHAFPDAVAKQLPSSCDNLPFDQLNEIAIANVAFVSIHAINENTRRSAAVCLSVLQEKFARIGR